MEFVASVIGLEDIFDKINCCVAVCKKDWTITGINRAFAKLYGCETKDLIGKKPTDLYPDFNKSVFYDCCIETIETGQTISRVGYSIPLKGWYAVRTSKYDEEHSILIAHEISQDQNYSGFVPVHDTLTSLFNRHKFEDDLKGELYKKKPFGLIILDIVKLKKINEIYGILACDLMLMEIAGNLKLKLYNSNLVHIYRIAPDKFALLTQYSKPECLELIEKITDIFKQPLRVANDITKVNIAIGFNYVEQFNKEPFLFIEETENAVEIAKTNKTSFVEHNINHNVVNKKDLLIQIKDAFKNKEFTLYYQPQIDCIRNKICGAEALIRWNHKTKGILSPFHFIGQIEDFELTEELDKFVFEQVMKDSDYFNKQGFKLPLSLNISSSSLYDNKMVDFYEEMSKKICIDSSLLTIEITESSLIESIELSKKVISNFSSKGLKIAIDDFGAGYSSFGYLVRYPTDYLKIDREFITNIHQKNNLKQIVLNLIKMAHSLNMIVVAEGVEIEEEAQVLKKYGCDIIQGYLYGKPMPLDELLSKIKKEGISSFKSDFY